MAKVTFYRTTRKDLDLLGRVNGQLIYTTDTNECFLDTSNSRIKISDLDMVSTKTSLINLSNPVSSKLYYVIEENRLYKYINDEWLSIGSDSQVYYWDGTTYSTALELWNTIYKVQKENTVIVKSNYIINDNTYEFLMIFNNNLLSEQNYKSTNYINIVGTGYSILRTYELNLQFTISGDSITSIIPTYTANSINYLEVGVDYETPYIPDYSGSPVNKKYVDDNAVTFKPFDSSFKTNGTTQEFFTSLKTFNPPAGMTYLGSVTFSDMPEGIINSEVEVYVYPNKVYYCIMRSGDTSPYVWECNSFQYRGWEPAGKAYTDSAIEAAITNVLAASY